MKRVAITGLGAVSPIGLCVSQIWQNLVSCNSAINAIDIFDCDGMSSKVAGVINAVNYDDGTSDLLSHIPNKDQRKMERFIKFAMIAAHEAILDSDLNFKDNELLATRSGVSVGSGIGGLSEIYKNSVAFFNGGCRKVSPFFIPASLINLAAGHIAIQYGIKGHTAPVVTACATGTHSIGEAACAILRNDADVMIAGGAEAISQIGAAGFCAMRALSTKFNDRPQEASRPWDKDRDGFVLSEGAGIVVLEEYEHAKARGAKIYGFVDGYGSTLDAYHISAPDPEGSGAKRAMIQAIKKAHLNNSDIGYISAHGTSTPIGDMVELRAVESVFQNHKLYMSSIKSAIGHSLGAAGAIEAVMTILALQNKVLPPTLNLHNQEHSGNIDLVPNTPKELKFTHALSNSFGFGGANASIALSAT